MDVNAPVIQAPAVSFLSNEESEWIRFVNLRDWWERESQADYTEATVHIAALLQRYLDALSLGMEERILAFEGIAEEISDRLRGVGQTIVPNPHYSPDADWDDPMQAIGAKAFLFANIEGVAGIYASLGRFLSSPYVRRLGRCPACRQLYIAPDDTGCSCCSCEGQIEAADGSG